MLILIKLNAYTIQKCMYTSTTRLASTARTVGKGALHSRNKHIGRYNIELLLKDSPSLQQYIVKTREGDDKTIDFTNPSAVRMFNAALLKTYYGINKWEFNSDYLTPPIPSRADYIHYLADVINEETPLTNSSSLSCKIIDIGCGSSCIYPLLGHASYQWRFTGTDIDETAIKSAKNILKLNGIGSDKIDIRHNSDSKTIFKNIIKSQTDMYVASICNPPFHKSIDDVHAASSRKWSNLKRNDLSMAKTLNFAGNENELYCDGGEVQFVSTMMRESALPNIKYKILWFTTLVSKQENLDVFYSILESLSVEDYITINMEQGQKKSRILCWTFVRKADQSNWLKAYNIK